MESYDDIQEMEIALKVVNYAVSLHDLVTMNVDNHMLKINYLY